MAHDYL